MIVLVITLAAVAVVGTSIALLFASMQLGALECAVESCGLGSSEYLLIGDDGHTITPMHLVATLHGIRPAC